MFFCSLLIFLNACAKDTFISYTGNMPSDERIAELSIGQDKRQVLDILGSPSSIVSLDQDTWIYMSSEIKQIAFMKPEEIDRKLLVVKFNDNDTITEIEHMDKKQGQEILVAEIKTDNIEQEQGFFSKYFGGVGQYSPFGAGTTSNP